MFVSNSKFLSGSLFPQRDPALGPEIRMHEELLFGAVQQLLTFFTEATQMRGGGALICLPPPGLIQGRLSEGHVHEAPHMGCPSQMCMPLSELPSSA